MHWQKDDLVHHFVEALDQAITHAPFSHLFAQNLFPQDVYQHLTTLLPVINGYKPLNHRDAMRDDGTSTREVCRLTTLIWGHYQRSKANSRVVEVGIGRSPVGESTLSCWLQIWLSENLRAFQIS